MPRTPITQELLEKYGMSVAPPDDPIYAEGPLVIVGGEPIAQSREPQEPEEVGEQPDTQT